MKPPPLLLAASIVANAALVTTVMVRPDAPAVSRKTLASNGGSGASAGVTSAPVPVDPARVVEAINGAEAENLYAVLKSAGVEDDVIRSLVSSRIRKRYAARQAALRDERYQGVDWWKDDDDYYAPESRERRRRQKELNDEINAEIERVLGSSGPREPSAWERRRYGDLSADKLRELRRIEDDYRDLIGEINAEARDFRLPGDAEKIRYLNDEKLRDVQALLSPEEMEAYRLRSTNTAGRLRNAMTRMDATEQEYRAIFDIQRGFDEAFSTNSYEGGVSDPDQEFWTARRKAEEAMQDKMKAALGEQRYREYCLAQDYGYRQLQGAAERFGLPADTAAKAYALRNEMPAAALAVVENKDLDNAQKKEAIQRLASDARQRVVALYGAELADQILKTQGMRWVEQMERGSITSFDDYGKQTGSRYFNLK